MKWFPVLHEDVEAMRMFVNMAYIELGLVPPAQYSHDKIGSLNECLATLSQEDRRKACRKFRKLVRKTRLRANRRVCFNTKQRAVKYLIERSLVEMMPDNDE